jgi:mannosyltransferase OCH1-like enzyme
MNRGIILILILTIILICIYRFFIFQEYILNNTGEQAKYIPKKIFQTIADKTKIDPAFQENIDKLKSQNPDWEYTLFDDSDIETYIKDHYGKEYLDCYNMINPKYGAAKADFFRYLLMYREGGVYLDIKSGIKFPLNNIIFPDDEYILTHWKGRDKSKVLLNTYGEYQQWHIICRPNHPFLSAIIKSVMENIKTYRISDGVGKSGVLKVTGPIIYTESIMPLVDKYKHRLILNNNMIGLTYTNLPILISHKNRFINPHYSKIKEPIILSKND